MQKRCVVCGRFFISNPRVEQRQKTCRRDFCKKTRKHLSQRAWCEKNPGYFRGRYPYVKQWREKRKALLGISVQSVIQDKGPLSKPLLRLILLIPGGQDRMIQDEIRLRRQRRTSGVGPD